MNKNEPATDLQQLHRAVANALWPFLRAREAGWGTYRETRALSPLGSSRSRDYHPGSIPGPEPTIEVISVTYMIITTLWSEDWPGRAAWRITLDRNRHDLALARLNAAAIADYEAALDASSCRKPFTLETKADGRKRLSRNRQDGAITHLTVAALEAIARAAELKSIPRELEDQLRPDTSISLDLVELSIGRGVT